MGFAPPVQAHVSWDKTVAPMEQQPSEDTFRRRLGRDRGENFSLPYGVADCAAPPVSKRRLRSGPNLHPGDTHHCADGLFARDKHLVHDSANARRLVLFLARPRAGAAGVETCIVPRFGLRWPLKLGVSGVGSTEKTPFEPEPDDAGGGKLPPQRPLFLPPRSGSGSCAVREGGASAGKGHARPEHGTERTPP